MDRSCLSCGKPLGSRTKLCHDCESDGASPDELVDGNEAIEERVKRYFIVSSMKCAECEALHGTVTVDGEEHSAADFGIESLGEWELEMEKEEAWIREHRREVEAALPRFEAKWPRTVAAVRMRLIEDETGND